MERVTEAEVILEMADARRYSQVMGRGLVQREYRALAREVVEPGVPPGGKVLDVGTGPGFVAIEVARLLRGADCRVVGLDLSVAMLTVAAENAVRAGVDGVVTWRRGDAKAMPFEDVEFDVVVSNGSLHHWQDPLPVLGEIARVLKEDGRYVIHDSKRLQRGLPRCFARAIGMTIPPDFRVHYWNSIRSSYTPDELSQVLQCSPLQKWRIVEDFMDLMVVGEA